MIVNKDTLFEIFRAAKVFDEINELHTAEYFVIWLYKEYGYEIPKHLQ